MNDVDDLDDLERELGPALRVALRRIAAGITNNGPTTSAWANDDDPSSRRAGDGVTMVDLQSSTRATTARERRGPRLNAAAIVSAAAVVILAIAAVVLSRLDHDKPADRRAKAVAESFMKAWVRGDSDAVAALLSPDGFFDAWTAETLRALNDWNQAMGWQYQDKGCEVMSPQRVWCDYRAENDLTRAFGRDPVAGSFVLIIDGRTVTSVRDDFNIGAYRDIWTAFSDWVKANHPDDVDRMYTLAAGYARADPNSIALWKRYTGEFIQSGDAYIARARAICTAAHEKYDGLVAASSPTEEANSEVAARVLEEALAELQILPPPTAVKAPFDLGFSLIQQLVDALRRLPPADTDLIDLLTPMAHAQIGLDRCAINPLR